MKTTAAIAINTFREGVRQPVFWAIVVLTLVLMPLSVLFAGFALGEESRLVRDACLTSITIAGLLLATFLSSNVVAEEIEKKTALSVLCKPVQRHQFIIGKFCGVICTIALAYILLELALMATVWYYESPFKYAELYRLYRSGKPVDVNHIYILTNRTVFDGSLHGSPLPFPVLLDFLRIDIGSFLKIMPNLAKGCLLSFFEVAILTSAAVAFSTRVTMIFNVCLTFSLFIVGHQAGYLIMLLSGTKEANFPSLILRRILPNFEFLNYASDIAFDKVVPNHLIWNLTIYSAIWVAVFLLFAMALFDQRETA